MHGMLGVVDAEHGILGVVDAKHEDTGVAHVRHEDTGVVHVRHGHQLGVVDARHEKLQVAYVRHGETEVVHVRHEKLQVVHAEQALCEPVDAPRGAGMQHPLGGSGESPMGTGTLTLGQAQVRNSVQ